MDASRCTWILGLIAAAALSGCVKGAGAGPAVAAPSSWAPPPTVDDLSGSIYGLVVDDESIPISGAKATVAETGAEAMTDAGGRFTLNGLGTATYIVHLTRLGYESTSRKVDVKAGEVTNLMVTLKLVPLDESFTLTLPRNFHIKVDHDYVNFYLRDANANHSILYSLRCEPCWYVIHFPAKPREVLSEATWPPSNLPAVNTQAYNDFYKGWSEASYGTRVCFIGLLNGAGVTWSETCLKAFGKETKLKVFINGGFTSVSYDQRVSTWTSFAYNGALPEGFTALPPR